MATPTVQYENHLPAPPIMVDGGYVRTTSEATQSGDLEKNTKGIITLVLIFGKRPDVKQYIA